RPRRRCRRRRRCRERRDMSPDAAAAVPRAPAASAAPRRIKELEVMVADVIVETPDTATLVFFTGNDRIDYAAGHFLTIDPHQFAALERFTAFLEDLKGRREPPRAYSMSTAPRSPSIPRCGTRSSTRTRGGAT